MAHVYVRMDQWYTLTCNNLVNGCGVISWV